jgi:hypothetical protein
VIADLKARSQVRDEKLKELDNIANEKGNEAGNETGDEEQ